MTRDFTLEKYSELVQALKQNYLHPKLGFGTVWGVADYISMPKEDEGSCKLPAPKVAGGCCLAGSLHA